MQSDNLPSRIHKTSGVGLGIVTLICFGIITIVKPHTLVPLGIGMPFGFVSLLALSSPMHELIPFIAGWLGILLMIASFMVKRYQVRRPLIVSALLALIVSAALFVPLSDETGFTLLSASPFAICCVLVARWWFRTKGVEPIE